MLLRHGAWAARSHGPFLAHRACLRPLTLSRGSPAACLRLRLRPNLSPLCNSRASPTYQVSRRGNTTSSSSDSDPVSSITTEVPVPVPGPKDAQDHDAPTHSSTHSSSEENVAADTTLDDRPVADIPSANDATGTHDVEAGPNAEADADIMSSTAASIISNFISRQQAHSPNPPPGKAFGSLPLNLEQVEEDLAQIRVELGKLNAETATPSKDSIPNTAVDASKSGYALRTQHRKARRKARQAKQDAHNELMELQDARMAEKLAAAGKRIEEEKKAKANRNKEKERLKKGDEQQPCIAKDLQTLPIPQKPEAPLATSYLTHFQSLAHAFTMARQALSKDADAMKAKLTVYRTLQNSTQETAPKLIEQHLGRAETALSLLKEVYGSEPFKLSRRGKFIIAPSKKDRLKETIEEIRQRTKAIQKKAASRPPQRQLAEQINKVLSTTSILRSMINPPNSTKLRKGTVESVQAVVAKEHRTLVQAIAKAYPDLEISVNEAPIEKPETTELDPDSNVVNPPVQDVAAVALPRILLCDPVVIDEDALMEHDAMDKQRARPSKWKQEGKSGKGRAKASESEGPQAPLAESKVKVINSKSLALAAVNTERAPIPRLSYGLDRVLFNPGVYQLRDSRTGVYNFDPYLENIMPITEFDYSSLTSYITSSKDTTLVDLAAAQGKKYTGSTSSMTSVFAHFHYLLSAWRPLNAGNTTRTFHPESIQYTRVLRSPAAIFLHHKDGTYAIDADKEYDKSTILSMLGQSMEKLFTSTREEFERYRKSRSHELTVEEKTERNAYNYTTLGDFLMRSQLDAQDDRLPGTGIFDLKTRAVVSIRMDASNIHKGLGYEIRQRFGDWESYEREYYDLVRSAFLKYSLQVRMGRMDGIFVAYHNTQTAFGFQYFPLSEMDFAIHGSYDTDLGNREFKLSVHLLNQVLDRATERFPGRSLRLHFETRPSEVQPFMYIFAKPVSPEDIEEIQSACDDSIAEFERNVLGLFREDAAAQTEEGTVTLDELMPIIRDDEPYTAAEEVETSIEEVDMESQTIVEDENSPTSWEDLRSRINGALEKDELGVDTIRNSVENALEQSELMPMDLGEADVKLYVDALMDALRQPSNTTETPETPETPLANDELDSLLPPPIEQNGHDGEPVEDVVADETVLDTTQQEPDHVPDNHHENSTTPATTTSSDSQPTESYVSTDETLPVPPEEGVPEIEVPETETPGVEVPETEAPQPEVPEVGAPEAEASEAEVPEADAPGVEVPETEVPEAEASEAEVPEAEASEAEVPEADAPGVEVPETGVPETAEGDVVMAAVNADILAASVPHAQSRIAALKALLLIHAQKRGGELEGGIAFAQVREFERILSSVLADHTGRDQRLRRFPHPSVPITAAEERADEIIGFNLMIRNKVDGMFVPRPNNLEETSEWEVQYNLNEMPDSTAKRLYSMVLARRRKELEVEDRDAEWYRMFQGQLHRYSQQGRKNRASRFKKEFGKEVLVYGEEKPRKWEEAFESSHVEEQMRVMGKLQPRFQEDEGELVEVQEGVEEMDGGGEGQVEEQGVIEEEKDVVEEEEGQEKNMNEEEGQEGVNEEEGGQEGVKEEEDGQEGVKEEENDKKGVEEEDGQESVEEEEDGQEGVKEEEDGQEGVKEEEDGQEGVKEEEGGQEGVKEEDQEKAQEKDQKDNEGESKEEK